MEGSSSSSEEEQFRWTPLPPNANKLPKFTDADMVLEDVIECIEGYLIRMGDWTTRVSHCIEEQRPSEDMKKRLLDIFFSWIKYWAFQHAYVQEYRKVELEPLEETPDDERLENGLRSVRENIGSQFISELSRFYFLITYHDSDNGVWSLEYLHEDWWIDDWSKLHISPGEFGAISYALEKMRRENEKERRQEHEFGAATATTTTENIEEDFVEPVVRNCDKLWFRPVSAYTQRNLYDAVMLLTERINDYPYHEEICDLIFRLTARLGAFFLQGATELVFDIPDYSDVFDGEYRRPNRAFMHWAAAYFYELLQRVIYGRCIIERNAMSLNMGPLMHLTEEKVEALKNFMVYFWNDMEKDDALYLFGECIKENFDFPGDETFYRYTHPTGRIDRSDLILELRSERQAHVFFSTQNYSVGATIVNMIKRGDTHLSRILILNLLDRFFSMEVNLAFRNGVVIDQSGIQLSELKLGHSTVPCIVSFFSRPMLHFCEIREDEKKRYIFWNENIYETLVAWLLFIRHEKDGYVYRKNISNQIRILLGEDEGVTKRVRSRVNTDILEGPESDFEQVQQVIYDNRNNVIRPL